MTLRQRHTCIVICALKRYRSIMLILITTCFHNIARSTLLLNLMLEYTQDRILVPLCLGL